MQKCCFPSGVPEKNWPFAPTPPFIIADTVWQLPCLDLSPCTGRQGWVSEQISRHWLQCPSLFIHSLIINHSVPWRLERLSPNLFSHPIPLPSAASSIQCISVKISPWQSRSVKCPIIQMLGEFEECGAAIREGIINVRILKSGWI